MGVLAFARSLQLSMKCPRIPLSVYTCCGLVSSCPQLSANGSVRRSSLLKFRDLNSSASVMMGGDVKCEEEVVLCYGMQAATKVVQR
jgi:hypothetical protein